MMLAVLKAVADAPPPQFSGGGKWEAMHGATWPSTTRSVSMLRTATTTASFAFSNETGPPLVWAGQAW